MRSMLTLNNFRIWLYTFLHLYSYMTAHPVYQNNTQRYGSWCVVFFFNKSLYTCYYHVSWQAEEKQNVSPAEFSISFYFFKQPYLPLLLLVLLLLLLFLFPLHWESKVSPLLLCLLGSTMTLNKFDKKMNTKTFQNVHCIKGLTYTREITIKNTGKGKGSFPSRAQIHYLSRGNAKGSSWEQGLNPPLCWAF